MYSPGPGFDKSAPTFSGLITVFVKASLPVPNEKVFCPFTCTAKVEVVLFGLKRDGILYLSGGGDFDFPKENKHKWIENLPLDFCLNRSPIPKPAPRVFLVEGSV